MKFPFIDLKEQYKRYKTEINSSIKNVLNSTSFIMGPKIQELEKNLETYCNVKHSIACSSGTDALLLSLMALDIKEGDEVITTPFTFIATAEVISFLKAKPVFVDIDEKTFNIDCKKIQKAITKNTKVIMPVSIFGQCCQMDEINEIAFKNNLIVIEDAAQSFGASYKDKKSCSLSTLACTSFFPSKPLGCYGDGGAIFTNDDEIAKKIRVLLNHGQTKRYEHSLIGINGRLDEIQAAILLVKLKYFDEELSKREKIAKRYNKELKNLVIAQKIEKDKTSAYAQYSIRVKNREKIINYFTEKEIPLAIHYPIPLHLQEVFKPLGYKKGDFPISELVSNEIISLPMSPFLKKKDQDYVINSMKQALQ